MKDKLKTADLFAGVGGMRLAFELEGFETVYANDFEPSCAITYNLNFESPTLHLQDIKKVKREEIFDFDVLLAGFPCQPFSIAGHRKGFDDIDRGNLFFDIVRLLKKKKPKAVLLENVKNLKSHDNGRTFRIIKSELEKVGYKIKTEVLNSMAHGNIPQNRERIFIAGFLDRQAYEKFRFPSKIKLTKSIHEFIEDSDDPKYYYEGKYLYNKIKDDIISRDSIYQWRRVYVRENKKGVCPTLTANMGTGGHNVPIILTKKGIRKLTPRECFNFQGFPATFRLPKISDSKLYKQAGNSVTLSVVRRIAQNMAYALG